MAVDTFMAYVGVYPSVADAEADYELVKDLHTEAGLVDAYDAALLERRPDGKVKITKKHETPTRVGGVLGAGVGLATGLVVALFPFAAIGGGLLAATTAGGAALGAVAGHAAAGMSRSDLKELGFYIERAVKPKKGTPVFSRVGQTGANAASHIDTAPAANTYLYRVQAFNASRVSSYSNQVQARVR